MRIHRMSRLLLGLLLVLTASCQRERGGTRTDEAEPIASTAQGLVDEAEGIASMDVGVPEASCGKDYHRRISAAKKTEASLQAAPSPDCCEQLGALFVGLGDQSQAGLAPSVVARGVGAPPNVDVRRWIQRPILREAQGARRVPGAAGRIFVASLCENRLRVVRHQSAPPLVGE